MFHKCSETLVRSEGVKDALETNRPRRLLPDTQNRRVDECMRDTAAVPHPSPFGTGACVFCRLPDTQVSLSRRHCATARVRDRSLGDQLAADNNDLGVQVITYCAQDFG